MRTSLTFILLTVAGCGSTPTAITADAAPTTPEPPAAPTADLAPDFELTDLDGNSHSLDSLRGKIVVLEWFNPGCPFVKAAHDGPLGDMASRWTATGDVVWLAINSGAPGKQGHGVDLNRAAATTWSMTHPILVDESGDVGRAYGAKTTPQMVVIAADGTVAYEGALDNAPLGEVSDGGERVDYTDDALTQIVAGESARPPRTTPWGCSVKYAS